MEKTDITYKEIKAEIYNFRAWTNTSDIEKLKLNITNALKFAGYTVLKFTDYKFPIKGYTAIWLLAESHLAIHFFEEEKKCYIELSGCNREMNIKFKDFLIQHKINYSEIK